MSLVVQERSGGRWEYTVEQPLLLWVHVYLLVYAFSLTLLGLVLSIAPLSIVKYWPLTLTPLTGRAIGAWWIILATGAWWALRERDWLRVRSSIPFHLTFFGFQLLTVIRFRTSFEGGGRTWSYVGMLVLFFTLMALVAVQQERARRTVYAVDSRKQELDV